MNIFCIFRYEIYFLLINSDHYSGAAHEQTGFIVKTGLMAGNLGLLSYAIAQVINLNEAINKSGRQRMLSQRMAKAYLQLGQGIEMEQSRKILESSLNSFEHQHAELKNFAPTQDNKQLLSEMEKNWQQYKKVLLDKQPNQQDARAIMVLNEDVLSIATRQPCFDDVLGKIADTRNTRQYAINVATTSERILSTMDGITSLYPQLA